MILLVSLVDQDMIDDSIKCSLHVIEKHNFLEKNHKLNKFAQISKWEKWYLLSYSWK